jgi:transposase
MGLKLYELGGGEVKSLLLGDLVELGRYNYGYQQVYGKVLSHYGLDNLFDRIARKSKLQFDLKSAIFLMLIDRLQEPCSKLATYNQQLEYLNQPTVELHHLYRSLDRLADNNLLVQKQIFTTGRDLFNQKLDVVFYDVTTFYFESEVEKEDELRQMGFGKDGKIGHTQILFCMMIDRDKNPIGYRIFKGNTFEGHTFEKALGDLKNEYQIDKVIVVADRGMLSKNNIQITKQKGFEFIIGERLKSLPKRIKDELLDLSQYKETWTYKDNTGEEILIRYRHTTYDGRKIISTYSDKRAKKDKHKREEKVEIGKKLLQNPALLNKKSTRFFLKTEDETSYELNEEKIKESERYDGFLAICTNNDDLPIIEILDQYKQLYKIEHSFRTFKSHLETRPMFHWTDKRIEGHICLCYIAFALQNYVLQKANKDKSIYTESNLRKILDKMQVSLLKHNNEEIYVRSASNENESSLIRKLDLKPLFPITPKEKLII